MELWIQHRAEIMRTWTGKRRPWAAKEFDSERTRAGVQIRTGLRDAAM